MTCLANEGLAPCKPCLPGTVKHIEGPRKIMPLFTSFEGHYHEFSTKGISDRASPRAELAVLTVQAYQQSPWGKSCD